MSFRSISRVRILILAVAACSALTVGVPATAAAANGQIRAFVSAEDTHAALGEVQVCALGSGPESQCEYTSQIGAAELSLPPGEYVLAFLPGFVSESRYYLAELYENALSFEAAKPVTVTSGGLVSLNVELERGGVIEGTAFTSAGVPAGEIPICYEEAASNEEQECTVSEPSGRYEITGLRTDSYKVEFSPSSATELEEEFTFEDDGYLTQWWKDATDFTSATAIPVTQPEIVEGIDAHLLSSAVAPVTPVTPPVTPPTTSPSPSSPTPPAGSTTLPFVPKKVSCKRPKVKRKVKGKLVCVKPHKAKHHRGKQHPKQHKPASR